MASAELQAAASSICEHTTRRGTYCESCAATAKRVLDVAMPIYKRRLMFGLADAYETYPHATMVVRDLYRRAGIPVTHE